MAAPPGAALHWLFRCIVGTCRGEGAEAMWGGGELRMGPGAGGGTANTSGGGIQGLDKSAHLPGKGRNLRQFGAGGGTGPQEQPLPQTPNSRL